MATSPSRRGPRRDVAQDRVDERAARGAAPPAGHVAREEPAHAPVTRDPASRAAVVARTTVTEPREIGTALTRRPEPPKPKPVLTWAELMTLAWLRTPRKSNPNPEPRDAESGHRGGA